MNKQSADRSVRARRSPIVIFAVTFIALASLTTAQNAILGSYLDYAGVPFGYYVAMAAYWILVSAVFAFLTQWQFIKNYEMPMKRLAKATKAVAGGDFSVYVRSPHSLSKADYVDVMITDFNKMVEELGSIETLKTEFFSNVSHEIKTPLAVVQNHAEMLRLDTISDEQRKEYASTIIQSTKKLSALITNILKLNRLEQQAIQPLPDCYDLCAQLSECSMQFESVWEERGIFFEADLEDRATVLADESLLELVWNNLLSNAFKFTGQGGSVMLTQTSTEDEVIVSVADTGCGMCEETLKRIFDKFYQGDTSHATEGNGLGLSLSLRVVQQLGGTITAKSVLGEGSEFTVRIPIERS